MTPPGRIFGQVSLDADVRGPLGILGAGVESDSLLGFTKSSCIGSLSLEHEDYCSPFCVCVCVRATILPTNRRALHRENAPSTLQRFEQ